MEIGKELVLKVTGEVVEFNGKDFKQAADKALEQVNSVLETDQDFAQAKKDIKDLKTAETRISQIGQDATLSTKAIAEAVSLIEQTCNKFRDTRLSLEKLVKKRETEIKEDIVNGGISAVAQKLDGSWVSHGVSIDSSAIISAIKNKRSLEKIKEAVAAEVALQLASIRKLEETFANNCLNIEAAEYEYPGLFPDYKTLCLNPVEQIAVTITARVEKHKNDLREAAERKAEKEKQEAEHKAKRNAEIQAAQKKLAEEKPAKPVAPKGSPLGDFNPPPPSFPSPDDLPLPPKTFNKDYTITVTKFGTLAEAEKLAEDIEAYWPDCSVAVERD